MKTEKERLEEFILQNPDLERLELMLGDFNLFETLNLVNAEIRHSSVLSWLLDPNQNHGTGYYFLNLFLKYFITENKTSINHLSIFDIEMFNYSDVEVLREWKNIDILITIKEPTKKLVIAIENKILSSEHSNQLVRYREIIDEEFKEYSKLFIFLTPESMTPSDENWINFNYSTVSELINKLLASKSALLNEQIVNFIIQYNTILKRYIVGNSDIEKICKQIYKKHRPALDLIFQYKPDVQSDISDYLKKLINDHSNLIFDSGSKTTARFSTVMFEEKIPKMSEGWLKSKRFFVFEFLNNVDRLVLKLYMGPAETETRETFFKNLSQNQSLFPLTNRTLGKKGHCVYQKEFLKKKDFDEREYSDLADIILKKWEGFLAKDMNRIDQYIEEIQST